MSDGGKKKLIMIAVAVLVLLGGGGFGYKVLVLDKKKAAAEAAKAAAKGHEGEATEEKNGGPGGGGGEEEENPAEGGGQGGGGGPSVLVYKNIVNLEAPRKNTYLKVEMHIIFRDPELGKAVAGDKPTLENSEMRAILLEMLSGKKLEEAQDMEAREALRLDIKDRLNEKFKPKPPKEGEKVDPKHKKPKKPIKEVLIIDWAIAQ